VKKLSDAPEWIAEALSMVLKKDVAPEQIDIAIEVEPHLQAEIERTRTAISELAQIQENVAIQSRALVRNLNSMQMTGVDIAAVLQISPQRVSQLLK
jgi:DNA-directed RNA polymerase specialized sigma subunit